MNIRRYHKYKIVPLFTRLAIRATRE